MILLIRYILSKRLFSTQITLKSKALLDSKLLVLFNYIADHAGDDLSNRKLAEELGFSKEYVGQWYKKLTGDNLQNYVAVVRFNKALDLLQNTTIKIGEISKMVGYPNPSYSPEQ